MRSKCAAGAILLLALIPSARLAWRSRDMPHLGLASDDGIYLECAKSLAEGTGYRILSLPEEPFQTKYPPLYPWLLSLVWRGHPDFPSNLSWFSGFAWAPLPVLLVLAWMFFGDAGLTFPTRLTLCAFLAINPRIVLHSMLLVSDLLFCCLLLACLILAERASTPGARLRLAIAAGLLGGLAYLMKNAAAPLLLSAPIAFVIRRQYRRAVAFGAAMMPAVAWWSIWAAVHRTQSADLISLYYTNYIRFYFNDLRWSDLPLMIWSNLATLLRSIRGIIFYTSGDPLWWTMISCVVAALCLSGVVRLVRRQGLLHYPLFGCLYALQLLMWHYPPVGGFILPLFPLMLAGFAEEVTRLLGVVSRSFASPKRADRAVALVVYACFAGSFYALIADVYTQLRYTMPRFVEGQRAKLADYRSAYEFIRDHPPERASFLAARDSVLYLYTGHKAAAVFHSSKPAYRGDVQAALASEYRTIQIAREQKLSYLFLLPDDLLPEVRRHILRSEGLQEVSHWPEVSIYRIP